MCGGDALWCLYVSLIHIDHCVSLILWYDTFFLSRKIWYWYYHGWFDMAQPYWSKRVHMHKIDAFWHQGRHFLISCVWIDVRYKSTHFFSPALMKYILINETERVSAPWVIMAPETTQIAELINRIGILGPWRVNLKVLRPSANSGQNFAHEHISGTTADSQIAKHSGHVPFPNQQVAAFCIHIQEK